MFSTTVELLLYILAGTCAGWVGGYVARWRMTLGLRALQGEVLDLADRLNSEVKKRAVGSRGDRQLSPKELTDLMATKGQRTLPVDPDEILNWPDGGSL